MIGPSVNLREEDPTEGREEGIQGRGDEKR